MFKTKIMNQLVRYLFLIFFLFCSSFLKAQFDNEKYDKDFFLIGTLNEYTGYQRTFTNVDDFYYQRIDIMGKKDLKKALFIDSLFSVDYPDITIVDNGASLGIKMYSPSLSQRIDDYYNYAPSGMRTGQMDTIYSGKLKKEKFVTEKQIVSFLLGAYLSYGKDKNKFSMPNATSKARLCEEFLKGLGCESVDYSYVKSIPAGNFVTFKPSLKIMEVINEAELLREYIETINTNRVEFTPDGAKYIWKEPNTPSFKKQVKLGKSKLDD